MHSPACITVEAHSDPDCRTVSGPFRLYDVTYCIDRPTLTIRRERVWAYSTDEARRRVKDLDPEFLATTTTPRIVR